LIAALRAFTAPALVVRGSRDRLDRAAAQLRQRGGGFGQHRPGRGDRVDGVELAVQVPALPVRSVHLDDRYLLGMQVPEQTGPVGTGASTPTLTTDPNDSSHDSSCR
jgi:hypothetical protein